MKHHAKILALAFAFAAGTAAAGSALAADTHPWQRVDTRDCNIRNHSQPPYPGTNWSWTSTGHRDYCVRQHRQQGNDELADKLQQHGVRERG